MAQSTLNPKAERPELDIALEEMTLYMQRQLGAFCSKADARAFARMRLDDGYTTVRNCLGELVLAKS